MSWVGSELFTLRHGSESWFASSLQVFGIMLMTEIMVHDPLFQASGDVLDGPPARRRLDVGGVGDEQCPLPLPLRQHLDRRGGWSGEHQDRLQPAAQRRGT